KTTRLFLIKKDLLNQIKALGESEGATLFMTLLTAFQVLLCRYSGQKDIVVGSPIANRHYEEIEGLIGFFVNTLALRTSFKEESFKEALRRVKEATLQAYQHQDVPFEQLVDYLQVPRSLNHNPIFQVVFALQTVGGSPLVLEGLDISWVGSHTHVAKFDLSLVAFESSEGLELGFEYASDLFEGETIERLAGCFKTLLEGIVEDPEVSIEKVGILSAQERHQILVEWNATEVTYPEDKCIHELFEEQVVRTPDNIAVSYEGEDLTYQELNERANQVAHYLRKLGVGPESLVALSLERSLELVIGLLGILKAGGAYVPLDPSYPDDRLQFMLEDTQASVLITQQELRGKFKGYEGRIVELLGEAQEEIDKESKENPEVKNQPEHLAYIIYT
ncbi:MAG: non-ribosomal peptide synthetase, partial [Alphaproteobacteria bacterium]|nr:non-ribosomal peptide synthetase [Alphaproteobacteria bacterium]